MATTFLTFNPAGIRPPITASATNSHRVSENNRQQRSHPSRANSTSPPQSPAACKWWSPLFGWSSDPDYIDTVNVKNESPPLYRGNSVVKSAGEDEESSSAAVQGQRSKFAPGCFTEEKAKRFRMMTKETKTFHDAMYHSAIASRLASDFSHR